MSGIRPLNRGDDSRRNWKTINQIAAQLNAQRGVNSNTDAAISALRKTPRDELRPWQITQSASDPPDPETDWRTVQVNPGRVILYDPTGQSGDTTGPSAEFNSTNTETPLVLPDDEPFVYIYAKLVESGADEYWEVNFSADPWTDEADWLALQHYQPPGWALTSTWVGFLMLGRVDTQTLRDQQRIQVVQYLDHNPVLPVAINNGDLGQHMLWRGTWSGGNTYYIGNVVRYTGATYVRNDAPTTSGDDGGTPGVSASWVVI